MESEEKLGEVKLLLSFMDLDDLKALASTVTSRHLKPKTDDKNAVIDVIVQHSTDALSLLRRKAVRSEILFKYLHSKGLPLQQPLTKNVMIDKVFDHWSSLSRKPSIEAKQPISTVELGSNLNLMALKFAEWFYGIYNSGLQLHCFWEDSSAHLRLVSAGNCTEDCVEGSAEQCIELLDRARIQHNLLFNVNLTPEGVQGRIDAHGIVLVLACGTLHNSTTCVGVFEQVFSLIQDPRTSMFWKIKKTQLHLREGSPAGLSPRLTDCEFTRSALCD